MSGPPVLVLENLAAHAGAFRLEISLTARRWPMVLLGPSGAGKTLLMRLLAGLEIPDAGKMEFAGESWFDDSLGNGARRPPAFRATPRRSIGYCLQDPLLFPHLSVLENVAYPLRNLRPGIGAEECRRRAREELERWGAAHLAGSEVHGLSGGEKGRVALARAFVRRPDLLLLDEPLAALDPPSREELSAAMRRILSEDPRPVIWVTHDRGEALSFGESLVVLLGGKVAQTGSADEVFRHPASVEVAGFVGVGTLLHGLVQAREAGVMRLRCGPLTLRAVGPLAPGTPIVAAIRSEEVELLLPSGAAAGDDGRPGAGPRPAGARPEGGPLSSARNEIAAVVTSVRPLGLTCLVEIDAGVPLTASVTRAAVEELGLAPGRSVRARFKAVAIEVNPEEPWSRTKGLPVHS